MENFTPIIAEAILRSLRAVTVITGSIVAIDSLGILLSPSEKPPHKPKWSAASWLIIAMTATGVSGYLLGIQSGLITDADPVQQWLPVWVFYLGLTIGFTMREVSRAHRPLYTVVAVIGLSIAGVIFALRDIAG